MNNQIRRELLSKMRASGFPGSILDVYAAYEQGRDLIDEFTQQQKQSQIQNMSDIAAQQSGLQQPQQMQQPQQQQLPSMPPGIPGASLPKPPEPQNQNLVQSQLPQPIGMSTNKQGEKSGQFLFAKGGFKTDKGGPGKRKKGNTETSTNTNYKSTGPQPFAYYDPQDRRWKQPPIDPNAFVNWSKYMPALELPPIEVKAKRDNLSDNLFNKLLNNKSSNNESSNFTVAESTNGPTSQLKAQGEYLKNVINEAGGLDAYSKQVAAQRAYEALPNAFRNPDVLTADKRSEAEKFARRAWTAISHPMESMAAVNRGGYIPSGYLGMHNPYNDPNPMAAVVDMALGTPAFIANAFTRQSEKFVDNPGEYLLTNTLGFFDPKMRDEALANYLDLAAFFPAARAASKPLVRGANNFYNKIATGNSTIPRAWQIEKPNFAIKSSDYIPKTYTNYQASVLDKFGKGMSRLTPEEWIELENLTKSNATDFSKGDYPISRILDYYMPETAETKLIKGLKVGDVYHTPSEKSIRTWSVGMPGGDAEGHLVGKTRLIIPSRYTKDLGSNFAGMPYNDKRIPFIWNPKTGINYRAVGEKEIMGNIPLGFEVIGTSNANGYNNLIIKPLSNSASGYSRIGVGGAVGRAGAEYMMSKQEQKKLGGVKNTCYTCSKLKKYSKK